MCRNQKQFLSIFLPLLALLLSTNFLCASNCCYRPVIGEPLQVTAKAAYLFWGVQEDQLGFAFYNPTLSDITTALSASDGKLVTHKRKWDSGVKVAASVASRCSPVHLIFTWTQFNTSADASAGDSTVTTQQLVATAIGNMNVFGPITAQTASSRWRLEMEEYALDLDFYGTCYSCFSFNPYIGVLGTKIQQSQKINYLNTVEAYSTTADSLTCSRRNCFYGVGPRCGIELNWSFYQSINLFTDVNFAYLVGKFHVHNKYQTPGTISGGYNTIKENSYRCRPMVDGSIGFKWMDYSYSCFTISFAVAYEFQYWWGQWQSSSNQRDVVNSGEGRWGDLSANGLTAWLSFTY